MKKALFLLLVIAFALMASAGIPKASQEGSMPDLDRLRAMTARFSPVEIDADVSRLPASERQVLAKLIECGKLIDTLFLRQVWSGNEAMLANLQQDVTPLGKARLLYFLINKGPWSRLDENLPFIPGAPSKPEGANFYPQGATKTELAAWLQSLPESERNQATGFFTVIRKASGAKPGFEAVPYSTEYRKELTEAARLLREAASLTSQPTLKAYLSSRADAFLSNDYYASDIAWMELDASIEPTIGPYEVYEDEWFNYKAGFEAFIAIRDNTETAKLAKLSTQLQDIENHLPMDPRYRNPKIGGMAPIRVVNEILASGDGNRGVQTAAFNLPNDERVIKEKGAKRVMLRNVQQAKFQMVLLPISRVVLSSADQKNVSFDAFFTHIVMHELMHGLGPHQINVGGRSTTVRQELKETYSAIEEAKADISGLFALQYLVDKGVLDRSLIQTMYDTFLASAIRSIRFGINEAHGRGIAIQLNSLLDYGAFRIAPDGTFSVNPAKIKDGVAALTGDLLTLEAEGNYQKAQDRIKLLAVVRPEIKKSLDRLKDIPVDIEPKFPVVNRLAQK
jgi:hypothetical protein